MCKSLCIQVNLTNLYNLTARGTSQLKINKNTKLTFQNFSRASVFDLNPRKSHPVQATTVEAETVQKKIIQPKPNPKPKNLRKGLMLSLILFCTKGFFCFPKSCYFILD